MADALSLAFATRKVGFSASPPGVEGETAPSRSRPAKRSRLFRFFMALMRRRRVRAELRALDESQMRDAGITSEALAKALQLPLSHYAAGTEPLAEATHPVRSWTLPAITVLAVAGIVGCAPPTMAGASPREACAALDLSLFSRIEETGSAGEIDPDDLWAANEELLSARIACHGQDYAAAFQRYREADRILTLFAR